MRKKIRRSVKPSTKALEKIDPNKIVYLDEAGINDNETSPRGYALKGLRCLAQRSGRRRRRISFIAALRRDVLSRR